jgi:hypothetical protein
LADQNYPNSSLDSEVFGGLTVGVSEINSRRNASRSKNLFEGNWSKDH